MTDKQSFSEQANPLRQPSPEEDDAHDLFPAWLAVQVPDLTTARYETNPTVRCKFFTPDSFWTWYVIEAGRCEDREGFPDVLFFGLVDGLESEYGYFALSELASIRGPMGQSVERDVYFDPRALSNLHGT